MELLTAQVRDNEDFSFMGRLLVYCEEVDVGTFYVTYVSPYSAAYNGGFVAIPEIGSEILIAKSSSNDEWYYLGSIFDFNEGIDLTGRALLEARDQTVPDKEIYRARGVPQRILLQDPLGNKLVLSNSYNPDYMNIKAELQSHTGKTLSLVDSPKIDACIFKNEHGDGIKITSGKTDLSPARSIELESKGPQKLISRESELNLTVVEGREIDILNMSTGHNKDSEDPKKYGNINILSDNNDINLTVFEEEGKVFIDALGSNGLIQIDSGGKITLFADGNVELRAGGDMLLKAEGNIGMEAGGNVVVKSGGTTDLGSDGETNVKAGANVNIDGQEVHLNSGFAQQPDGVDVDKEDNNYGN